MRVDGGRRQIMLDAAAYRRQTAIALSGMILWQVYSAITAYRSGDALAKLLKSLGAETGPGVSFFLLTHRWWLVVPAFFVVLSVRAIRRLDQQPMLAVWVLAAGVVVALVLNIFWREALFGPIFSLIQQVG